MLLPKLCEGLILQNIGDECLGYKQDQAKAFCLNPQCAQVAALCQEGLTQDEAIARLASLRSIAGDEAEGVLCEALSALRSEGLLQEAEEISNSLTGMMSRRRLLEVGAMAAAVPLIASVFVPAPAAAASAVSPLCTQGAQSIDGGAGAGTYTVPVVNCGSGVALVCINLSGAAGGGGGGGGPRRPNGQAAGVAGTNGQNGVVQPQVCQELPAGSNVVVVLGEGGTSGQPGQQGGNLNPGLAGQGGGAASGDPNGAQGADGTNGAAATQGGGGGGGGAGGTSTATSSTAGLLVSVGGAAGGAGGAGSNGAAGGAGGAGLPGGSGPAGGVGGGSNVNVASTGQSGSDATGTITFSAAP